MRIGDEKGAGLDNGRSSAHRDGWPSRAGTIWTLTVVFPSRGFMMSLARDSLPPNPLGPVLDSIRRLSHSLRKCGIQSLCASEDRIHSNRVPVSIAPHHFPRLSAV